MSAPSPQGSYASSGNLGFCRSKLSQISSPAGVPVGSMMRRAHDSPTATGNVLAQPLAKCSGNVQHFDRVPLAVICRANSIQGPREGPAQLGRSRDSRGWLQVRRSLGQLGIPDFPNSGIPAKSGFKSGKIPFFFGALQSHARDGPRRALQRLHDLPRGAGCPTAPVRACTPRMR